MSAKQKHCRQQTILPSSTHEAFSLFMMASYKDTAPVMVGARLRTEAVKRGYCSH
jgi:hypothetical protein